MKTAERRSFPLYPTDAQKELIITNCNNARFAYNFAVARIKDSLDATNKVPSMYKISKEFNEFKHQPGNEWLIAPNVSQRATKLAIVKQAWEGLGQFMKYRKRPPSFKSKRIARMSYCADYENTRFGEEYVVLEGLGKVKCKHNFPYTDKNVKVGSPTVIFTGDLFELSVVLMYGVPIKPKYHYSDVDIHHEPIGIDVGIAHLMTTSDGSVYDNIDVSKIEKRIARLDRRISKIRLKAKQVQICETKTKSSDDFYKSQNLLKLEAKRRKLYQKHANVRKNMREQAVADIVKKYPSAIVIEDIRNPYAQWSKKGCKNYNKRIKNAAIGLLFQHIYHKCEHLDIPLIKAPKDYPSTKRCSCCGNVFNNKLTKDRMFICSVCGYIEDRDKNASYNLRDLADDRTLLSLNLVA